MKKTILIIILLLIMTGVSAQLIGNYIAEYNAGQEKLRITTDTWNEYCNEIGLTKEYVDSVLEKTTLSEEQAIENSKLIYEYCVKPTTTTTTLKPVTTTLKDEWIQVEVTG